MSRPLTEKSTARPRRRRTLILSGVGAFALAAILATTILMQPPAAPASAKITLDTALVSRGDLTEQLRAPGTLAYADARDLGTSIPGTITSLPEPGHEVGAGQELFRIDDEPVVLMHGVLPMWRAFESGMGDGPDVLQLEANLAALGHFGYDPDEEFTWRTAQAIREWQESVGLEESGYIPVGRIIFADGDVRVSSLRAAVGDASSPAILASSALSKSVVSALDPSLQTVATPGTEVSLTLPDGTNTVGTVSSVSPPTEMDDKSIKVLATISLNDPEAAAGLDNITVTVGITKVKSSDVLIVPVLALLAQPDGGYAVSVVAGSDSTRSVEVTLGAFANGSVEITEGELSEGDEVVVGR